MFIVSFRVNCKKIVMSILVILLIAILGISLFIKTRNFYTANTLQQEPFNFTNIKSNEERIAFLKQFGWEVEEKPIEMMEVRIPDEFGQVYLDYNEYQKEIGLDLEKYKGKRVKRYTYKVLNYPKPVEEEVRANIFIYNDRVIAGDIMTTSLRGFMQSLLYKVENSRHQFNE